MTFLVAILIAVLIAGAVIWQRDAPRREQALQASLDAVRDFTPALSLFGVDGRTGIALDPGARAVSLMQPGHPAVRVDASQLLAAELYRDGQSVGAVRRADAAGTARLQQLSPRLAPPVVRTQHGEITRWQEVRRVELRVIVDDEAAPVHDVRLLDREVRDTDAAYRQAIAIGQQWLVELDALMR